MQFWIKYKDHTLRDLMFGRINDVLVEVACIGEDLVGALSVSVSIPCPLTKFLGERLSYQHSSPDTPSVRPYTNADQHCEAE